jgi:hypothetical protein
VKLHRLQTFRNHASDSSSLLLTATLVLVVEYQIVLSRPVHISEAVFSPGLCLGRRQMFAGHFGCKPVAILVNAIVGLL